MRTIEVVSLHRPGRAERDRPLGDVLGEVADALQRRGDLHRGDQHAQVGRHRLAQRDHLHHALLERHLHGVERLVALDHLAGERGVAVLHRLQRLGQQLLAEPAHLRDLRLDLDEVLVEGRYDMRHADVLLLRLPAALPPRSLRKGSIAGKGTGLLQFCDGFVKAQAAQAERRFPAPHPRRRFLRPRVLRGRPRQPDGEGAAAAEGRGDLQPALVAVQDVLGDGEPEAGAALVAAATRR